MENDFSEQIDLAEQNIENGNLPEAENLLNEILSRNPNEVDALNDLSVLEIMRENYENASKILTRVIDLDNANEIAHDNIKYLEEILQAKVNSPESAETEIVQSGEDLLKNSNGNGKIEKLIAESEELIHNNNTLEARTKLNKITESESDNLDALNNLAVVEIMEENYQEASNILSRVIQLDPQNEIAADNIAYLEENLRNILDSDKSR
jgi:Flp pilus assembly protein TadD